MPTKNPRLALTLDPELYKTLMKLSKLEKRPASTIAAEMLSMVSEPLARVVALMELAQGASQELHSGLRQVADRSEATASALAALADNQLDFLELLVSTAGAAAAGAELAGDGGGVAGVPPSTNRGVRSDVQVQNLSLPSLPSPSPKSDSTVSRKGARNGNR